SMRHRVKMWTLLGLGFAGLALAIQPAMTVAETPASPGESRFVDHSLMISKEFPNNWPTSPFPRFHLIHEKQIGPTSPYNVDVLLLDGNTGTQLDVPPHSVARPELKREKS